MTAAASRLATFLVASALAASPARAGEPEWQTVIEGPITVKTRSVPGTGELEIWAEGEIDAPVLDTQAALMDTEQYARFMKHITESRYVGDPEPDGSRYAYTLLDLPIVSPRDYVILISVDQTIAPDGTGEFRNHWVAVPEKVPERDGVVRVKVNSGGWTLRPVEGGTKGWAVYRFRADPGGYLPAFAADLGNRRGVTGTFRSLEWEARRRAEERRLQEQLDAELAGGAAAMSIPDEQASSLPRQ
jgi:hypothetical protein